jgi:hypothetical protein
LKERLAVTPLVLDEMGRPSADFGMRMALWNAARHLKTFTEAGLFNHAKEHLPLPRQKVAEFVRRMLATGYICEMFVKDALGETEYQLKPAMNTGRIPPRFCESTLAFDVNRRQFFGIGLAREVKL